MAKDARVESALAHWAHRFVTQGIPLPDFQDVIGGIEHWDQWCRAWSDRGAVHRELAESAQAGGHLLTAGEAFTRAALCYHFAKFVFVNDLQQMRAAHEQAVACRNAALPYLRPRGRRVEIPFEDVVLPGNLRLPAGVQRPPLVLLVAGLDSAKEEMDSVESLFLARGMATLAFDGPGQGEAEYELSIRGDYEVAVTAIVDWAEQQPEVDPDRIGIWGVSLGGYYAPRAAAFEKRLKACIALAGPYRWLDEWDHLPEMTRETFRVRSGSATLDEASKVGATLSLEGVAGDITCPLLIIFGKQDRLIHYPAAERLAAEAGGPTTLWMIDDGNHGATNRAYRFRPQSADWMAEMLAKS
ncbi:MAG: alpha/beta fold hydrolase [Nitriliruptorales bacterium]|nr:alpha/beta fold hydrolase [Nitriliruptorales bacterium]